MMLSTVEVCGMRALGEHQGIFHDTVLTVDLSMLALQTRFGKILSLL